MGHRRVLRTLVALIVAVTFERVVIAQPGPGPSNPMELAVALANAKVPAGIILPDAALGAYRSSFPEAHASAEALGGTIVNTAAGFAVPLAAQRQGRVWIMQAASAPADVADKLHRVRSHTTPIRVTASRAVFNVVAGLLQEKEVSGVLGTGSLPDDRCPLQQPVELNVGEASVVALLNQTVEQAPGLVWFVTYDVDRSEMAVGVVCPGGQYFKMILQ